MSPFLANLMAGAILALVGWVIVFAVWVVAQNGKRKDEIHAIELEQARMRSEFVSRQQWDEFKRGWDLWKETLSNSVHDLAVKFAESRK